MEEGEVRSLAPGQELTQCGQGTSRGRKGAGPGV